MIERFPVVSHDLIHILNNPDIIVVLSQNDIDELSIANRIINGVDRLPINNAGLVITLHDPQMLEFFSQSGVDIEHIFHEKYKKLVHFHINKMTEKGMLFGCEYNDIMQECFLAIRKRTRNFDHTKSKIGYYIGIICKSVCLSYYTRKIQKRRNMFVEPLDDKDGELTNKIEDGIFIEDNHYKEFIDHCIKCLFEDNPKCYDVLSAIFGDPKNGIVIPDKIVCTKIAEESGLSVARVNRVYNSVVVPYLRSKIYEG